MRRFVTLDENARYFVVGSVGNLNEGAHYHGLYYSERVSITAFNRCFKACHEPYHKPISDLAGWASYILGQGREGTIITNIQEKEL